MSDVVVTVPKWFGLDTWIAEGDPAGSEWSGEEWAFYLGGSPPHILPDERVYVVYNNRLRGYAPLIRIGRGRGTGYALIRGGNAVAMTINEPVRGLQGFRYRWWTLDAERLFPDWTIP